jgi:hypothetical protein
MTRYLNSLIFECLSFTEGLITSLFITTELEIVNFINICFENRFVYEFMTTELFIDKDVSKTDETLHDECIFKSRK